MISKKQNRQQRQKTESDVIQEWAKAENFDKLCKLAADFFAGKSCWHPTAHYLCDETTPLLDRLAVVNRAGFLTFSSQPGVKGPRVWQREYVEGLATPKTVQWLERGLRKTSLYFREYSIHEPEYDWNSVLSWHLPSTLRNGREHTFLTNRRAWAIEKLRDVCDNTWKSWVEFAQLDFVVVVDLEWGRQDYLFDTLVDCFPKRFRK